MGRYETFLVRHWWLDGGGERVEVTHIPTGVQILLMSLAQATEWMASQSAAPSPGSPAEPPPLRPGPNVSLP